MEFAHAGRPSFVSWYYYNVDPPQLFSIANKGNWHPASYSYVCFAPTLLAATAPNSKSGRSRDPAPLVLVCVCTPDSNYEWVNVFLREFKHRYLFRLFVCSYTFTSFSCDGSTFVAYTEHVFILCTGFHWKDKSNNFLNHKQIYTFGKFRLYCGH